MNDKGSNLNGALYPGTPMLDYEQEIKGDTMSKTDIIGGDNLGGATRKMTTQDKLTLVVQEGVKKGYSSKTIDRYLFDSTSGLHKSDRTTSRAFSISDLITDPGFMKAVYGEETVCPDCGKILIVSVGISGHDRLAWCGALDCTHYVYTKLKYIYHALEATKLLLTSTPDAAIEYLYKEMKDE